MPLFDITALLPNIYICMAPRVFCSYNFYIVSSTVNNTTVHVTEFSMPMGTNAWGIAVTDQFYWRQHEYFGTIPLV